MFRLGMIVVAVAAGVATGALVFKIVGEEQVGGEVKALAARLGLGGAGNNASALDLLEKIAPGTQANMTKAAIMTVGASLLTATAVTIAVREIAS